MSDKKVHEISEREFLPQYSKWAKTQKYIVEIKTNKTRKTKLKQKGW
jgi:hypothetical protein